MFTAFVKVPRQMFYKVTSLDILTFNLDHQKASLSKYLFAFFTVFVKAPRQMFHKVTPLDILTFNLHHQKTSLSKYLFDFSTIVDLILLRNYFSKSLSKICLNVDFLWPLFSHTRGKDTILSLFENIRVQEKLKYY